MPHSLRGWGSFIAQIRAFYAFRTGPSKKDQGGRWRKRTADIDCSRAWRSPFFPPPSVSSIAATKSVAADLSSSFLTDQTAAAAVVVWFFIARCRAAFFGWKKKERERATAWQPSSQGTVVQYNLPSLGNATTSSRCRSTPRCPAGQPWRKN